MDTRYSTLLENKSIIEDELRSLISVGEVEKRYLSEAETETYENKLSQLNLINDELRSIENQKNEEKNKPKQIMEKKLSVLKFIAQGINGNFSPETRALLEEGTKQMTNAGQTPSGFALPLEMESRALSIQDGTGDEIVATEKFDLLGPLMKSLVTPSLGATMLTGLVGDISLPAYAGQGAVWAGENATIDGSIASGIMSEVKLTPKRLSTSIVISKQFLAQDSVGAEAVIRQDLTNAIAAKLEETIFGAGAGVAGSIPKGLANGATLVDCSTWSGVVGLETAVDTANALQGNLAYVTNAGGRGFYKSTPKVSGQAMFIMDGNEMNGYPVAVTNHVPKYNAKNGVLFGDFGQLYIGQWGGLDIIVDPYTLASTAQIKITVTTYFDFALRRPTAMAFGTAN